MNDNLRRPVRGFNDLIQPTHKAASRSLGYALTADSFDGWHGFRFVISARLTDRERAALAYMSLTALTPEEMADVMAAAADLVPGAGPPLPPLGDPDDDAVWYASTAPLDERHAHLVAIFESLPPADREEFVAFANGGAT